MTSDSGSYDKGRKSRPKRHPDLLVQYLTSWMMSAEHVAYPYPSDQEKEKVMQDTGMELKKLETWLKNYRRRHWKPRTEIMNKSTSETEENPKISVRKYGKRISLPKDWKRISSPKVGDEASANTNSKQAYHSEQISDNHKDVASQEIEEDEDHLDVTTATGLLQLVAKMFRQHASLFNKQAALLERISYSPKDISKWIHELDLNTFSSYEITPSCVLNDSQSQDNAANQMKNPDGNELNSVPGTIKIHTNEELQHVLTIESIIQLATKSYEGMLEVKKSFSVLQERLFPDAISKRSIGKRQKMRRRRCDYDSDNEEVNNKRLKVKRKRNDEKLIHRNFDRESESDQDDESSFMGDEYNQTDEEDDSSFKRFKYDRNHNEKSLEKCKFGQDNDHSTTHTTENNQVDEDDSDYRSGQDSDNSSAGIEHNQAVKNEEDWGNISGQDSDHHSIASAERNKMIKHKEEDEDYENMPIQDSERSSADVENNQVAKNEEDWSSMFGL